MATLIRKSDKDIMRDLDYTKNSTFYKDMLAFYDAYAEIMKRPSYELPNYMFIKDQVLLDGLCLLIKDCAFEFKFETLNPSLDYLKILYFSIAEYSKDGELPTRKIIEKDFEDYKNNFQNIIYRSKEIFEKNENRCKEHTENYKKQEQKYLKIQKKLKTNSKIFISLIPIFLALLAFFVVGVFIFDDLKFIFIGLAAGTVALFVLALILTIKKRKKLKEQLEKEKSEYELLGLQDKNNIKSLNDDKLILNKIYSEYYDCNNFLIENIYNKSSHNISELLDKMAERQILSYNLKYDIMMISKNQDKEISEIIAALDEENCNFDEIYRKIVEKNWIFYNSYVRCKFISNFYKNALNTHRWKIEHNGENKNPFNLDIKSLSEERVGLFNLAEKKIYGFPLEYVIKSNILNKFDIETFDSVKSNEELKMLKNKYANSFFSLDNLTENKESFCEVNLDLNDEEFKIEDIQKFAKVPTLFEIEEKLKIMELNLDNSNANIINQTIEDIIEKINMQDKNGADDVFPFNLPDDIYGDIDEQFDTVEDIDEGTTKYTFAGNTLIGFKINF